MMRLRNAFTVIELIIMVVILGLAFATLPMILGVSSRSVKNVSDVRGLYHGVAKMQIVLSKPWDESNVNDFETGGIYYVIKTTEDTGGLVCDNDKNRSGHYPGMNRRMCENAAATSNPSFTAEGDFNDLDDFDGDSDIDVEGYSVDTAINYISYVSGTSVLMPTAGALGTSNIKQITVTVTDPAGFELTKYRYYATNIGLSKPFIKRND